jgi:hypothetical protein
LVLGRLVSLEGKEILDGPFESADEAMRHSITSADLLSFHNLELVERAEKAAPVDGLESSA